MKDLHLKFKMDTGNALMHEAVRLDNNYVIDVPTDEYFEFLETIAEKYLAQAKVNAEADEVVRRFKDISIAFENLKEEINGIDEGDIPDYQFNDLNRSIGILESAIYD